MEVGSLLLWMRWMEERLRRRSSLPFPWGVGFQSFLMVRDVLRALGNRREQGQSESATSFPRTCFIWPSVRTRNGGRNQGYVV
jgi:hypothetical protein